jgi:hypothetical protein
MLVIGEGGFMRSGVRVVTLLAAFLLILQIWSFAQSATTSLRGTVTDANGAVLPGATVVLNNSETGFSQTSKSDSQGAYQFLQLSPGTYTVTASASGFATFVQNHLVLLVSTPATLNVAMQVAGQTVTLEVTGEAPLVNTTDATLGNTFDNKQVLDLPFEGRNPNEILSLQPGAFYIGRQVDNPSNVIDTRNGAMDGGRSDQANITLDGVDDNDQVTGKDFTGAVRSTLDSVEEFRVTTLGANADEGRSSGGQINLVTKSGTNIFHGTLYEYNRNNVGEANDWFNKQSELLQGLPNQPTHLVRNTYGGSLGGPILKNRLFFFGTYEGQRTNETQEVARNVPGNTLRAGMIAYPNASGGTTTLTPAQIASTDPNCRANGTCPLGPGPDPMVVAALNQYPVANSSGGCADADGFNFACFTFAAPNPQRLNTTIAKLDYNLNQSGTQHLFVRGNLQQDTLDFAPQFPGQPPAITEHNNSRSIAASYNATISNTLINSFRYGYTRFAFSDQGQQTQPTVELRFIDDLIPLATNGATATAAAPTTNNQVPVHNWVDDLTWIKGKHTLQFGGNIRQINNIRGSDSTSFNQALANPLYLASAPANVNGDCAPGPKQSLNPACFGFAPVDPNNIQVYNNAAIDLVGIISQVTGSYNRTKTGSVLPQGTPVSRHFRSWEYESYVQDAWRVKPNLTLTAGLRYTILEPPYETSGTQAAPNINVNNFFTQRAKDMLQGQVFDQTFSFDLSGQANGKKPYWPYDYKDLGPRLAFAYSPGMNDGIWHRFFGGPGKSSIRGGFGIVYDHFGQSLVNTFDQNGTFGLTTAITNAASIQTVDGGARYSGAHNIPISSPDGILLQPAPTGGFPATPPVSTAGNEFQQIALGLDDRLRTPYSQVMDFSFTRELPGGFTVEAAYVGRLGRRLLQQRDMAMPLDLVDTKSHTDYFTAATMFSKAFYAGANVNSMAKIPYWENMFPGATGVDASSILGYCGAGTPPANPTATQSMYELYSCNIGAGTFGETNAINIFDTNCIPACATINGQQTPFAFFNPQYTALYAWSSIGNSSYHAAQLVIRSRERHGLQFDFNYSLSHSIDEGSDAERVPGFGGLSAIVNSWSPQQLKGDSDFDARHQINSNWVYELPIGKGKSFGTNWGRLGDTLLGGWQITGLGRWSSGLPFSIGNGGTFPTNFQISGTVFENGTKPATGKTIFDGQPNVFKQAGNTNLVNDFRFAFPGESGQRNNFRGDGFFGIDMGLDKVFKISERQSVKFSWETFNVTNSVRFDVVQLNVNIQDSASFGQYGAPSLTLPRVMQFALRYSF